MRFFLIPALILLLFNAIVDFAVYKAIVNWLKKGFWSRFQAISAIVMSLVIILVICLPKRNGNDTEFLVVMWALYAYLTIYLPKIIFIVFYYLSRLPRLWHKPAIPYVAATGAVLGVILFATMWWGALINRYNIQVNNVDIPIAGLPQTFNGLTIAQISDLHVGTFGTDTAFVSKLVDRINSLHPDVIVFTGDIVNRKSEEIMPFLKPLSRLHAPLGVYSVLGNHDYGDYSDWPTPDDKTRDVNHLKQCQDSIGWHMLNNATDWLVRGNDSIAIIGVENIGDPPFTVYGDLHKAYADLGDRHIKILLSHNPAHWENAIMDHADSNVALTLSGHTHAMQITVLGWSPAAARYSRWGGLYSDSNNRYMYVNIGAGTVGMPYRIGATPEITLLKLTTKPQ